MTLHNMNMAHKVWLRMERAIVLSTEAKQEFPNKVGIYQISVACGLYIEDWFKKNTKCNL